MQDEKKILADAIGKVLTKIRLETGKSLNLFCNEYSLPHATLNELERGKYNAKVFSLIKIVRAYGLTLPEFFEMVEKELPKDFLTPEV